MSVSIRAFGEKDGQYIRLFTIRNNDGCEACISTLGATLTRWTAPDRNGDYASIVLGYQSPEPYLRGDLPYFNSIVGRYANRIDTGRFSLNGKTFQLSQNEGDNHLHGGFSGFDKKVWEAEEDGNGVLLRYTSADGEEGYPGTLHTTVRYQLGDENTLTIICEATTEAPTIVNLTMHGWFNLSGKHGTSILDHELLIDADLFIEVGPDLIPTDIRDIQPDDPFNFCPQKNIGSALNVLGKDGLDNNFCWFGGQTQLYHPGSGRILRISTDQPGMQVYTGQGLDGSIRAEDGTPIPKYGAIVLEPQHFPDSPNHDNFPSTVLRPGETYRHVSRYRCSVKQPG